MKAKNSHTREGLAIERAFLKLNNVVIRYGYIHHYNKTWLIIKDKSRSYIVEGDNINTYNSITSAAYWTVKNNL